MNSQIVLDLDDVQGDFLTDLVRVFNARTGLNKKTDDITDYQFSVAYPGFTNQEVQGIFIEEKIIENLKPLKGAAEATRILTAAGYDITVVTARSWHPRSEQVTAEWLEKHGCVFKNLCISTFGESKREAYSRIASKFALIVDDHLKNIDHAIESEMFDEVALITKPWNKSDNRFVQGKERFDSLLSATQELILKKAA